MRPARPGCPMLILAGRRAPEAFRSVEGLAARIHELTRGRPLTLTRLTAAYPGFAACPAVKVVDAGVWFATAAEVTPEDLAAALADMAGVRRAA